MKQQERREQAWTTNFLIEGMTHQPQDHCVVSTTESSDGCLQSTDPATEIL